MGGGRAYWMETSKRPSRLEGLGCWKRTWVAWVLDGVEGLRKSRLPREVAALPGLVGEKKSTRAPMRGVEEGVSWPHILLLVFLKVSEVVGLRAVVMQGLALRGEG